MLSQGRINNFQGTDFEYIIYLESIVRSRPVIPILSPPSPRSEVREEAVDGYSDGDEASDTLRIIPYEPETKEESFRPAKRRRTQQRWEREMDEMIPASLYSQDWISRRNAVGLSSATKIIEAFDMLTGTRTRTDLTVIARDDSVACHDSSKAILQLLTTFANATAVLEVEAEFTTQVHNFRVFVFVSLCCVALYYGVSLNSIDDIMRKCISDSHWRHLARLRRGALWTNRMMNTLVGDGFGHLAYEVFVLWGRPISHYGRFADAGNNGFSFFRNRMPQCKPALEIQESIPFWPPFIIKAIVGKVYSLSDICVALGCDGDSQIQAYPRYLQNYINRRMPLPQPAITGAGTPLGERIKSGGEEVAPAPAPEDSFNPVLALLMAAHYTDQQVLSVSSAITADKSANHIDTTPDLVQHAGENSSPQRAEGLQVENRLHMWEGLGIDLHRWEPLDIEDPFHMWEGLDSGLSDALGNGEDVIDQVETGV